MPKSYHFSFEGENIMISASGYKGPSCNTLPQAIANQFGMTIEHYEPTHEAFESETQCMTEQQKETL